MLQNLDRLRFFYYVYSQKSIVAAADSLHVTQSAVSQSLKKLEDEIQTLLFTRLHKKLIPTSAGERLFAVVKPFISDLDTYQKELEQSREVPFGELRIGSPPEFGKVFLFYIMSKFREKYRDVVFSLEFGLSDKLIPLLKEGRIDFILLDEFLTRGSSSEMYKQFHFEPVMNEEVIMACSRDYYQKNIKDDISFSVLSKQEFITYKNDMQIIKRWFNHHFSKFNVKLDRVLTVDNHEAVVAAILNSVGLGVITSHIVKEELHSGRMIKIKTDKEDIINTISLVQLLDKVSTLTEKVFARFLINTIQKMKDNPGKN